MSDGPIFRHLDRLEWETAADQKPEVAALAAQADSVGARRSRLTTGQYGFHSHISEMPAGFEVPPHTHDVSELMVILEGSITGEGLRGPAALLAPLAGKFFEKGMAKNLATLKARLEG